MNVFKIALAFIVVLLSQKSHQPIVAIENLESVTFYSSENFNYESVKSKEILFKVKGDEIDMYTPLFKDRFSFLQTDYKSKYKKHNNRIEKLYNKYERKYDSISELELDKKEANLEDKFWKKFNKVRAKHRKKKGYELSQTIEKETIQPLLETVNQPFISADSFWFDKTKNFDVEYPHFYSLDEFLYLELGYYPFLSVEFVTNENDTLEIFTNSQNNPPLPWKVIVNDTVYETYNNNINLALYGFLPQEFKKYNQRLVVDLDSAIVVYFNQFK